MLATVAGHNGGSRRVLEKAGFELVSQKVVDDRPEAGVITLLEFQLA